MEQAGVPDWLTTWVGRQRWYVGKGRTPRLREVARWVLPESTGATDLQITLLEDTSGSQPSRYQVPLSFRRNLIPTAEAGLITTEPANGGPVHVYDAVHDPLFGQALLDLLTAASASGTDAGTGLTGHPAGAPRPVGLQSARVLSGEQSNTSVVLRTDTEPPVIAKIFRVIHPGPNPDVEVQTALANAGSRQVPTPLGWVTGSWSEASDTMTAVLAFAQEFIPGVTDAWQVALDAVTSADPFIEAARSLGTVTAEMHQSLARVFGRHPVDRQRKQAAIEQMRQRLALAVTDVPQLRGLQPACDRIFASALATDWLPFQRIHGDYHLGQVLLAPERGWVVLDFEGEPLRPLAERTLPDSPLRDVAGMLRSFDYAVASQPERPGEAGADWATGTRAAFLAGYRSAGGDLGSDAVLAAFEVDKAIYEARYEALNRPSWLEIPLIGIQRLVAAAADSGPG